MAGKVTGFLSFGAINFKHMKRNSILLAFVLMVVTGALQAQGFQKTIDLGGDDYANMSVPGTNGSHYLVGSSSAAGGGDYDAHITKVDASGAIVWEKQYGGPGTEFGTALIGTSDGNLLMVGRSNSGSTSQNMVAVKVDTNGAVLWANMFATDSVEYAFNVAEGPGGYLVVGETKGSTAYPGRWDVPMIMLDQSGNVLWSKTFGAQFGNEVAYDLFSIGTDGWVIAGYTGLNNIGLNDGFFALLDLNGNLQATFEVGGTGDDDIRRALVADKAVFMVGNTRGFGVGVQDVFVAKYDVSGGLPTLEWFKTYGGSQSESITSAHWIDEKTFVVTALTNSFGTGDEGLYMLVDTNGNVQLSRSLGTTGGDVVMDLEVSDNPVLIGYTNSYNGGSNNDLLVASIDSLGKTCNTAVAAVTPVTQQASVLGPVIADFTTDTFLITTTALTIVPTSNAGTNFTACLDTTSNVGIAEVGTIKNLSLLPNPANSTLTFVFDNAANGEAEYTITNLYGAVVYSNRMDVQPGVMTQSINVNELASGWYMLNLQNGALKASRKFAVVH